MNSVPQRHQQSLRRFINGMNPCKYRTLRAPCYDDSDSRNSGLPVPDLPQILNSLVEMKLMAYQTKPAELYLPRPELGWSIDGCAHLLAGGKLSVARNSEAAVTA
uniref:(northern house mosquito) hypothetical protein n=1 Tax=Culex pipiens TaxID=7175 RepID=A0A8D8KHY2_CULPI